MKDKLFNNIEFLLTTNNCVVIPNLGGFLLNKEDAICNESGAISAPSYSIAFNPDLKHDDGLLTYLVSKQNGVSYNSAMQIVHNSVDAIKKELMLQNSLVCGRLGTMDANDRGQVVFSPASSYIHPLVYGLSNVSLSRLHNIQRVERSEKRNLSFKQIVYGATAAAAALFLFLLPQSGGMSNDYTAQTQSASFTQTIINLQAPKLEESKTEFVVSPTLDNIAEIADVTPVKLKDRCFIVIAGDNSQAKAENMLQQIRSTDFPDANIVLSAGRYRIYSHAFHTRVQAESFLSKFRDENPKYNTAWIHIKQ